MNIAIAALAVALLGAEPAVQDAANADQVKLLKTFRAEFVSITPGKGKFPKTFQMGSENGPASERPARTVKLEKPFSIAKYETTQDLWQSVMGSNPSRWKGPRNSVEMLSYDEAEQFCKKTTQLMRRAKLIGEDEEIRLPSEAEWEYTARAGTTTKYSFGDDPKQLDRYGWSTENAAGNDPPVGAKEPNAWGLYDMHGYLWEWCSDHGFKNYQGAPANSAPRTKGGDKSRRVIRSGSWKDPAPHLTSSFREPAFRSAKGRVSGAGGIPAKTRDDAVGLRCVLAKVE